MILYDGDDKLCVASGNVIRLWDFYDKKEVPPEMYASHEFKNETIMSVFLNEHGIEHGKGPFVFIVVTTLATGVLVVTIGNLSFGGSRDFKAVFSDVTGMNKGDDVRIAGVKVGTVSDIEIVGSAEGEARAHH